ncbi:RING-H2 finger protein ATL20-like [Impatiens glandulifera]|uniref:RING-H2 finger protein ATL20-like n=1 Tax=Impatiens glandulifera TaxID=253017 RepID=UPI001FB086BD|nr:RING-H2 finger protein ATL20-like [Impatiens glandulifera]
MDLQISQIAIILFSLLLILTAASAAAAAINLCPATSCRHRDPTIRFPFRLNSGDGDGDTTQPKSCGYPGFDLSCDNKSNQTIINIGGLLFTVKAVDYATQQLWINDPDNCLPNRLLSLNLSDSAFRGVYPQDFTLFNCSLNLDLAKFQLNPVGCLSGPNYSVFATSSDKAVQFFLSKSCTFMASVQVPVQWPYYEQVVTSDLSDDIRLTWLEPRCRRCETRRGRCGLQTNFSLEVGCSQQGQHGLPRTARYAITVGAGLPAMLCVIGMLCFVCGKLKSRGSTSQNPRPRYEFNSSVAPQPTLVIGLDGPTIESFPKLVLGESRRLPKPNDNICPICLSEYHPKETLRTLPDCTHCFHADCVDEWLRLNASCPVCRSSHERHLYS